MAITLDQFRDVDLVIDKANDNFIQRQFVSQGDYKGRTLTVQVTDNGVIGEVPGLVLNLRWQNQSAGNTDLSAFELIDKTNSVFRIEYPQNMMTPGKVIAHIQVIQNGKTAHMKPFELTVQKLAGEAVGIVEKNEYSALVAVLSDANKFRTDINSLDLKKVDKGGTEQVTWGMMSQSAKEQIVSGSVAVVGIESVGNPNLINNSVTADKTTFVSEKVTSSNFYNPQLLVAGYYVNYQDGKLVANSDYFVSGYIEIPEWAVKVARSNAEQCAFYDSTFRYISGEATAQTNVYFNIPSGAKYFRASLKATHLNTFAVAFLNQLQVERFPPYQMYTSKYKINNPEDPSNLIKKVVTSNNYFDKSTVRERVYVDFESGIDRVLDGYYASDYIEIPEWAVKVARSNAEQCAFYSDYNDYISGEAVIQTGVYFDIPENAKYMRVSLKETHLPDFRVSFIAEGEVEKLPAYDEYSYKYIIGNDSRSTLETVIRVPETLSSINSAISYAKNTPNKRMTIHLSPGSYEEVLSLRGNTNIDFVGINKDNCIIVDHTGNYDNSPLQISGNGFLENMKIISDHEAAETIPDKRAYAVHADYAGEGVLKFSNCILESYQNAAVGIGTHRNQTIVFERCDISTYYDSASLGGLYLHNNVDSNVTNQKLVFRDCYIYNQTGTPLVIDDACDMAGNSGSLLELEFINCTFWSDVTKNSYLIRVNGGTNNPEGLQLAPNIRLSPKSRGNNIDILNAY